MLNFPSSVKPARMISLNIIHPRDLSPERPIERPIEYVASSVDLMRFETVCGIQERV